MNQLKVKDRRAGFEFHNTGLDLRATWVRSPHRTMGLGHGSVEGHGRGGRDLGPRFCPHCSIKK